MATPITVTFSGELAEKIQQLASMRQQNIDDLVETLVNQAWPDESEAINELAKSDAPATPEMQTYIALHPVLKEKYFGQYVAIYQGKLIDHDPDHEALYRRIDAQYPDEFVWISRVEEEAIPTLVFRSPRIEWNEPAWFTPMSTIALLRLLCQSLPSRLAGRWHPLTRVERPDRLRRRQCDYPYALFTADSSTQGENRLDAYSDRKPFGR